MGHGRWAGSTHRSVSLLLALQAKPKLIEPLDYENVIVQKKTQILNDCRREMLLFPYDDFQVRPLTSAPHISVGSCWLWGYSILVVCCQ